MAQPELDPSSLPPWVIKDNANLPKLNIPRVHEILAVLEDKQAQLASRISEVKAELDSLLSQQLETQSTYEAYKSLLAPIRRLPSELLGSIFTLALPIQRFITPIQSDAPLTLLRVCRLWRSVALATPGLWASIHITHRTALRNLQTRKEVNEYANRVIIPAMKEWLGRAGTLRVAISVEGISMQQSLLNVFLENSRRCVHLEIKKLPSWSNLEVPSDQTFPVLETLHIQCFVGDVAQFSRSFTQSPRLHTVFWEDATSYGPDEVTALPALPWSQLTNLSLGNGSVMHVAESMVLDILSECPGLEVGAFSLRKATDITRTPINLPVLTKLVLWVDHDLHDHAEFLEKLILPNLHALTCNHGVLKLDPLAKFCAASDLKLETLCLYNIFPVTLQPCLELIGPTLKFLAINHHIRLINQRLLQNLSATAMVGRSRLCLCPKLERLYLIGCVDDEAAFTSMVRTRLATNSARPPEVAILRTLGVHAGKMEVATLRELKTLGLEVLESNGGFLCTI